MKLKFRAVLSVMLLALALAPAVLTGSLWCQDNIVSPGITMEQLLEACGEPASRNGANWIYNKKDLSRW